MPDLEVPNVSAPADRALQEAGIRTLQDLSRQPATAIASLHGVGPKAMKVWAEALARHGLEFAETEADAEGHPS